MPRGFKQNERERIQAGLLEQGRLLFRQLGPRKTNVEELTRAAGISKGAFYLFFDSKEALFFSILEGIEAEFQAAILGDISASTGDSPARFAWVIHRAMERWQADPLLSQIDREDYAALLRRLPPERIEQHIGGDDRFAAAFAEAWRSAGIELAAEPQIVSGMLRAVFLLSLQGPQIGEVFPEVLDRLIDLIAGHLVQS